MNDYKMLKALESICMGKRNAERLRHVYCKDGTAYATDSMLLVAVQDAFTEPHGHDGIEVIECVNGMYQFRPFEVQGRFPGFESCFSSHMNARMAEQPVTFAPHLIQKATRVFAAMGAKHDICVSDNMSTIMSASSTDYLIRALIMGIR